ncbi:SPOR domain-containing protein [Herbaspirillum sp. RV1423]|uniref:SPOR domain-containing protein n=1 Tax=Herbaspirillum sp. RV1423 TaxID=1443993 RepID=UPI0004BCDE6A|nr:SPOR domain-containing protein [Herbaspirillum sp. RV1423]
MGLFSFFRKNKQESASGQGEFLSRSAGESSAIRGSRSSAGNSRKSGKAGKEDSVDPVLPEKKRARRRLIGAVALVLAVVIVLPMILDSEPRPLADDIAIQIPSKDGKDTAKDAGHAADKPQAAAEPKEEFVDPATMNAGVEKPAIAPGASAMPSGPANVPLAPETKPALPIAEKPADKPEPPKETPKPVAKADAKADVKDSKVAAKPAERKDERKKDVKEAAKPKTADKPDDAARALAILEGKPATADKKPTATPAGGGKFVIQVAALATQEKVDELRGKLSGAGIKSYTQKVATQSGDRTRIRVGPFANRDEADKMRAKINKLGLNATIVPA